MPRVLIIDDEPGIRFALKRWFERQQWSVCDAADGRQAIASIEAATAPEGEPLDVIVCDLHLPGLSGSEIVHRLRQAHAPLAERLILTTGDAVDDAHPDSVLRSHPHVLQKPFDLATLRTVVERIVGA